MLYSIEGQLNGSSIGLVDSDINSDNVYPTSHEYVSKYGKVYTRV
ncbi:hypothetical protein ACN4EG_18615 [Alkalinema pantanalense CENA528]